MVVDLGRQAVEDIPVTTLRTLHQYVGGMGKGSQLIEREAEYTTEK